MSSPPIVTLLTNLDVTEPRLLSVDELIANFAAIEPAEITAGPMVITSHADASRGQSMVEITLGGTSVKKQLLTLAEPALAVDVAANGATARGEITLELKPPPQISAVVADLTATDTAGSYPFKGDVDTWAATGEPVIADYVQPLDAVLSTLTSIRGTEGNIANFSFYAASQLLASMTATQLAPKQIWPTPIIAGEVNIRQGAQINLTIPTTSQDGSLFLVAEFSTLTTPKTPVASTVAKWPLPPPS